SNFVIAGAAVRTVFVCLTLSPCLSAQSTKPTPRLDLYGDPLPPGAVARLGTMRLRHSGTSDLTFSKDGKRLISCSEWDGAVRVWDAASGRQLRWKRLASVKMLLPGGELAAAWYDSRTRLHDVATGEERGPLLNKSLGSLLTFSPDGKMLVFETEKG